jgi:hypothetical protein
MFTKDKAEGQTELPGGDGMDVPILVCGCGMRMRAPGARPGRVGRCPACGGRLEVPVLPPELEGSDITDEPEPPIGLADAPAGFGQLEEIALTPARTAPVKSLRKARRRRSGSPVSTPMADGLLPVQQSPEAAWTTSFLYPLRGAESLAVIAVIGVIAWVFAVLVPEYCLKMMADATSMGASLLGLFFVWVTALPVLFLGPLVLTYWLQYLGRVLVSSAMGECVPPRMPDRNFDGFLTGLSPWFVWLVLGLGVGLAPALSWAIAGGRPEESVPWLSIVLTAGAMPYLLAALMLSFLHDDATAAMPWGVLLALIRLGGRFLLLSALVAGALGLVGTAFALALLIRRHVFWLYLPLVLVCWTLFLWVQMAVMRLLGLFYLRRKDVLRWNHVHPRWGVAWKL